MKVTQKYIRELASSYTGGNVGHYSILLGIPSQADIAAKWFAERANYGVRGYATVEEAERALVSHFGQDNIIPDNVEV